MIATSCNQPDVFDSQNLLLENEELICMRLSVMNDSCSFERPSVLLNAAQENNFSVVQLSGQLNTARCGENTYLSSEQYFKIVAGVREKFTHYKTFYLLVSSLFLHSSLFLLSFFLLSYMNIFIYFFLLSLSLILHDFFIICFYF